MSDDVTTMTQQAQMDRANAELTDTAIRVASYFKILVGSGIPEAQAAMMTSTYNAMLLARHFDIEMYGLPMDPEGEA